MGSWNDITWLTAEVIDETRMDNMEETAEWLYDSVGNAKMCQFTTQEIRGYESSGSNYFLLEVYFNGALFIQKLENIYNSYGAHYAANLADFVEWGFNDVKVILKTTAGNDMGTMEEYNGKCYIGRGHRKLQLWYGMMYSGSRYYVVGPVQFHFRRN